MSFKKVDQKQSFPKMEEEILKSWKENDIFNKSVEKNRGKKPFIFFEGPPTANGKPGLHHVLARSFKDIIPRYKTMKGFLVERKAGWDTHGLPVEIQVEKSLGIKHKHDILNIVPGDARASVIEFNTKCKESVWQYKDLWEKMTTRMGYWVDMDHPYVTYDNTYVESVWWTFAQIAKLKTDKGEDVVYKGHKVVPYCYRCGTALASHEVAQGYQTVKDNSAFIKFKVKPGQEIGEFMTDDKTFFYVWTTTPWTIPGNVALAVGPHIRYTVAEKSDDIGGEKFIYAQELSEKIFEHFDWVPSTIEPITGLKLLGLEYEPLYETNDTDKKAYYVVSGDFVTTQEGTGIVHIAPAFGADDSDVGKENNLPTLITVDEEGKLIVDVPGKGIEVKKKNDKNRYAVDDLIVADLKERELFFKEQPYEHEYPFCWRCDTPLIYYAKPSWFIRMSAFSDELVKNNENINWVPEYIKEGRFGEWLRGIKDWAISRDRYWGTPLPIWECGECGEKKIIESIDEIKEHFGNPNKLFMVRHGEAENNAKGIMSSYPEKEEYPLTEKGKRIVLETAESLKGAGVDIIVTSPLQRTRETAQILSQKTNAKVIEEDLLKETDLGTFNGAEADKWLEVTYKLKYQEGNKEGVETHLQLRERMTLFLEKLNKKYQGKNIVIVSHGDPLRTFESVCNGITHEEMMKEPYPEKGKARLVYSKPLDVHKPFIDDVKFKCTCGGEMTRTPEVMDVWFDSGSMPLAQFHYPNGSSEEDRKKIEAGLTYPADYISEAIDQTRGWFYTLHAISTLLNKAKKVPTGNAFKNVICLAHILDKNGKKMSKSRGNVVEPMEVMDQYGADMLRWMLFTINQPGMPKKFDIKGMQDIMNRVFRMLWNSYSFFVMYAEIDTFQPKSGKVKAEDVHNLLDKWILSELNVLVKHVDEKLEAYDIYAAAKSIESYIDNLSNWYIRRSRKRFWKSENDTDKNEAYATLHHVLVTLSQLMAPFTPFIAEEIYTNLTGEESVHLSDFPVVDEKIIDERLNENMQNLREIVSLGLQERATQKIKVRQPLSKVILGQKYAKVFDELISNTNWSAILTEELNVHGATLGTDVELIALDTEITEDLKLEGQAREIIRFIQEMRKEAGYDVDNRIKVYYAGLTGVFEKEELKALIAKETLAEAVYSEPIDNPDLSKTFAIDDENGTVAIIKAG